MHIPVAQNAANTLVNKSQLMSFRNNDRYIMALQKYGSKVLLPYLNDDLINYNGMLPCLRLGVLTTLFCSIL